MVSLIVFSILAAILMITPFVIEFDERIPRTAQVIMITVGIVFLIIGVISYPYSNLWQKELSGKALLREAEWSRKIKILESEAFLKSAENFADAEVARAKGAAKANEIVADGLGGPEGYLRYLYIEGLKTAHENGNQIIYIPTEAGLPILEANRLTKVQQ